MRKIIVLLIIVLAAKVTVAIAQEIGYCRSLKVLNRNIAAWRLAVKMSRAASGKIYYRYSAGCDNSAYGGGKYISSERVSVVRDLSWGAFVYCVSPYDRGLIKFACTYGKDSKTRAVELALLALKQMGSCYKRPAVITDYVR